MQKVFKEEQIDVVSRKINLSRVTVKSVVERYIDYLVEELCSGKTIKVFNICYLRVKSRESDCEMKTLAYISSEIGKELSLGGATVLRVLSCFEDQIVNDLRRGNGFTLRGLVRIQTTVENGCTRLRIRKATCYNSVPVYTSTLGSFRRRVFNGG